MKGFRNTFTGMDQDRSKSKQSGKSYFSGTNIKVITEEGTSTGNIENEDGNLLSFKIPDTPGAWGIRFDNPTEPSTGTISIVFPNPGTTSFVPHPTVPSDNIEDLYSEMLTVLSVLPDEDYRLVLAGNVIRFYPRSTNISDCFGEGGLSNNDGTYETVPQSGLEIIGWTNLRDEVVLFTTNSDSETPSSAGQIWRLHIDHVTKQVAGLTAGGFLSVSEHLMYNNKLNFSKYWHIGTEAVGHYENSKTGRVYWTDEYNEMRSANVLDPELIGLPVGALNIVSSISMSLPVVTTVGNGTLPSGASVQYAYRLFNDSASSGGNGAVSVFSPICNPIPLGDFDPTNTAQGVSNDYDEVGGIPNTTNTRSVTYSVSNIDPSFKYIEHISIMHMNGAAPIIKIFSEDTVPSDGNIEEVIHSVDEGVIVTPEEFVFLNRAFKRCKTLTVKDKRLIVANLDTLDVAIDGFDSRSYRFDKNKTANLIDKEVSTIVLNAVDIDNNPIKWDDVPEKHDVINEFNTKPSNEPDLSSDNKFQSDGSTLGGSGKNISYKFTYQDMDIKNTIGGTQLSSIGYPNSGVYSVEKVNYNRNEVTLNGEVRSPITDHTNYRGPMMSGSFVGHAAGETYRYAIVFFDLSSSPFNAKWIGDIKFPERYDVDGDGTKFKLSRVVTKPVPGAALDLPLYSWDNPIIGRNLGITFEVDVSSIKQSISGYEIVRVKRLEKDKSRLGTGVWAGFTTETRNSHRWVASIKGSRGSNFLDPVEGGEPANLEDRPFIEINGGDPESVFTLSDEPRFANSLRTGGFISPSSIMNDYSGYSYNSGDELKTIGFMKDLAEVGEQHQYVNTTSDDREVSGCLTMGQVIDTANGVDREVRTITEAQILSPGAIVPTELYDGTTRHLNTSQATTHIKTGPDSNDRNPAGLGDKKQVVKLDNPWKYYQDGNPRTDNSNQGWRLCSYNRSLINQYGGNTFESRTRSEYISTGCYHQVFDYSDDVITKDVYGGDTYVHQFSYLFFNMNYDQVKPDHLGEAEFKYHLGWNFPVETSMNLAYMRNENKYGNKDYRDLYSTGAFNGVNGHQAIKDAPKYVLDWHYQEQNDVKKIFYPADYIENTVEEHPHRLWASEKKQDGELLDSWKSFLINNYSEVDGQYGPVNKVDTLNDKFYFYQDRAFGLASINDRSVINDENGVKLTLGSGGILDDYGYISRLTGTKQKFSVVSTDSQIHHFDTLLKKWMVYSQGGTMPLSDAKGMHSFFKKFNTDIVNNDRLLMGKGVHGVYDPIRNKVMMTFQEAVTYTFNVDDNITSDIFSARVGLETGLESYTLEYNANTQSFESFSDDIPNLWLRNGGNILSLNPGNNKESWLSYAGNKNNFYGTVYDSAIEILVNPQADITCIMDNIEYKSEMFIGDIDQSSATLDSIQVLNDHQNSGVIPLTVDANIVRKFRSWRLAVPRDDKPNDPRIRDYYMKIILKHKPNSNERLVLHDIITYYRSSPH
jgi:hypothetical protein